MRKVPSNWMFSSPCILTSRNFLSTTRRSFSYRKQNGPDHSEQLYGNRKKNVVEACLFFLPFQHFSSYPVNKSQLPKHPTLSSFLVRLEKQYKQNRRHSQLLCCTPDGDILYTTLMKTCVACFERCLDIQGSC